MKSQYLLITLGILFFLQCYTYAEDAPDNWPCIQRFVPELSAATIWPEQLADTESSQTNDAVTSELINKLADRHEKLDEVQVQVDKILKQQSDDKADKANKLFAGVFTQIQNERKRIIKGIFRYTDRQRKLGERIENQRKILKSNEDSPELDTKALEDLQVRQAWDIRVFRDRERQLNYLCEQPVKMEQRLFSIARLLQGYL